MQPTLGQFQVDFSAKSGFRLFSFEDVLAPDTYQILQEGFSQVPWIKKDTYFYTQYKSYVTPEDAHPLALLYQPSFFFSFKKKLEKALGVSFQNIIRVIAHKLITADEIGVHNDYADPAMGYENFRFIIQFSQPNQLVSGGELIFLASKDKQDVIKQYSYASNTGICFEITRSSYHYVTAVEGERHTIVLYLWEKGRKYDGTGTRIKRKNCSAFL